MTPLHILDDGNVLWACDDLTALLEAAAVLLPGVTIDVVEPAPGLVVAARPARHQCEEEG